MNLPFRIEEKESFRVVGYKMDTTNKGGEGRKTIPNFWSKFMMENRQDNLRSLSNADTLELFGVNIYNTDPEDSRKFQYLLSIPSEVDIPKGLCEYVVPAMTWAIFPCTVQSMGKTEALAITKWLPKSKYRPLNKGYFTGRMKSGAPDIEYYGQDGNVEIWVAVKEK